MAFLGSENLTMRTPSGGNRSPMAQNGGLLPPVLNSRSKPRVSPYARGWLHSASLVCIALLLFRTFSSSRHGGQPSAADFDGVARRGLQDGAAVEPVLVSYSYFEKDQIQRSNMEFFMAVGMGLFSQLPAPANTHFVIVISGGKCTPCKALMPMVRPVADGDLMPGIAAAWVKVSVSLQRIDAASAAVSCKALPLPWNWPPCRTCDPFIS